MITALGPRLGLGLRLDFGSQVWFVQYFSEKKVIVLYVGTWYSESSLLEHWNLALGKYHTYNSTGIGTKHDILYKC